MSKSQLAKMAIFNLMIKKKVNLTVPFMRTVVLIRLHLTK